jgi:hypothetical protein
MGLWSWFRRLSVGSDPYYASYGKAMQRIKWDLEKCKVRHASGSGKGERPREGGWQTLTQGPSCALQVQGARRRQFFARVQARFWAGFAVLYVAVLAYAAWVRPLLPA